MNSLASGNEKVSTSFLNDNEELIATIRYSFAALKRCRKKLSYFVFSSLFVHMQNSRRARKVIWFLSKVFLFVVSSSCSRAFRSTKYNFSSATAKMDLMFFAARENTKFISTVSTASDKEKE